MLDLSDRRPKSNVRVFLSRQCPVYDPVEIPGAQIAPLFLAIGSSLITATIDKGLSTFSSALKSAAGAKSFTYAGERIISLYHRSDNPANGLSSLTLNPDARCVLVVSGEFDPDPVDTGMSGTSLTGFADSAIKLQTGFDPAKMVRRADLSKATPAQLKTHLNKMGVPLSKEPDFIYEGFFDYTPHDEAFILTSTFLMVNELKSGRTSRSERNLGISIAVDGPHEKADTASTLRATTLDFGEADRETRYVLGSFPKGARSLLMKAVPPDATANLLFAEITTIEADIATLTAQISTNRLAKKRAESDLKTENDAAKKAALATSIKKLERDIKDDIASQKKLKAKLKTVKSEKAEFMPTSITATIVESKEENGVGMFFANVFEAASTSIGTALKDELDPAKRKAAAEAKAAKLKEEQEAAEEKLVTDKQALETLYDNLATTRVTLLTRQKELQTLASDANPLDREIAQENLKTALRAHNRVRAKLQMDLLTEL